MGTTGVQTWELSAEISPEQRFYQSSQEIEEVVMLTLQHLPIKYLFCVN